MREGNIQTYQVAEDALVQWSLHCPALPQLVVVVLQAVPVTSELFEAVLVDIR